MSDVTTLKCWPCCVRAIDWSYDGILALASSDQVELLFPSTESQDTEEGGAIPQWQHFPLQVPWFTKDELPSKEAAPNKIFSVGEEISTSYVVNIAWSPPGLARHGRCSLAVLTANLVLSVWASDGRPLSEPSWSRALIINDALERYFRGPDKSHKSSFSLESLDLWRLRRRIRAFSWAPAIPAETYPGKDAIHLERPRHMIAVANDDNQILILAIKSPVSELSAIDSWRTEILDCYTVSHQQPGVDPDAFTFDDMMEEQKHVMHLSWSPWVSDDDGLHSVLAYATNRDVRLRTVSFRGGVTDFGEEVILENVELRFAGPVTWSPDPRDGTLMLALFSAKEVVLHTIRGADAASLDRKSHHLDGRWDIISGVVWDTADPDHVRLHFSSNTLTTKCPTAVLEVTSDGLRDVSTPDWPYWREHISGSQGHFSAEHNLKGNANAKVWGLSRSPLGEYVASCHTVHPTDMIEYGTPADRRTHIAITTLKGRGGDLEFPPRNVSTEGIFFSARKWIEKNIESTEDLPTMQADIQQRLIQAYMPKHGSAEAKELSYDQKEVGLRALVSIFQHNAFNEPRTLEDRFEILSHLICTPAECTELPRLTIAYRLAQAVTSLPTILSADHAASQAILDAHQRLLRFIESILPDPNATGDAGAEEEEEEDEENASPPSMPLLIGAEHCVFCDAPIPIQDQTKAVCPNGHEFSRCGVSFLAIQSPGCTKTCGICNTRFLKEEVVLKEQEDVAGAEMREGGAQQEGTTEARGDGQEVGSQKTRGNHSENWVARSNVFEESIASPTPERELRPTLARVLFLACDACIYCGGKFVG